MPVQEIVAPWVAQPQEPAEIDWGNPITAGLAALLPLRGRYDSSELVSGRQITFGAGAGETVSSFGRSVSFGTATAYADFPQPEGVDGTTPVTIAWVSEGKATSDYSTILAWRPTGAANNFFIFRSASDPSYQLVVGPTSVSGTLPNFATGQQGNDVPESFVLVCLAGMQSTNAANYKLFRNGRAVAQAGVSDLGATPAAVARVGTSATGDNSFEGLIANVGIFRRALSDAEAVALSANPWQLYQPRSDVIPLQGAIRPGGLRTFVTPWDQQPQELLEADYSHPVAADLAMLLPLRGRHDATDLVSGRSLTFGAATGEGVADFGRSTSFGSSTAFVDFPQPEGIGGTTPITFFWVAEGRATAGYSAVFTWLPTGATNPFLVYRSASDSGYQFAVGPRTSSSSQPNFATGFQSNNAPEVFVLVCLAGAQSTVAANYRLFRNGVRVAQAGTTNFGGSTTSVARIGCTETGGDPFEGLIANFGIVRRALTDGEAESLSANPWQLYQRREFVPTQQAGGGSIELSAAATTALASAAALTTSIRVATSATASATTTASMATGAQLGSAATASLAASASLNTAALVAAAAAASLTASASLTTSVRAAAAATASLTASASLTTVPSGLATSASSSAVATSSLTTAVRVQAAATAAAATTSSLTTAVVLSANATATLTSSASMSAAASLAAAAIASAQASAALTTAIRLQALATASVSAAAWVTVGAPNNDVITAALQPSPVVAELADTGVFCEAAPWPFEVELRQ